MPFAIIASLLASLDGKQCIVMNIPRDGLHVVAHRVV